MEDSLRIMKLTGVITCFGVAAAVSITSCGGTEEAVEIITLEEVSVIDGSADPGFTFTPANIRMDSGGRIFVLDIVCMKVLVFDPEGCFLYEFGEKGEGPGEFGLLWFNFDTDESGNVYTIDHPGLIEVFRSDGSYRGSIDTGIGQVFDIAVVDSNRIYVSGFPWGPALLEASDLPAVTLIDGSGEVIREFGYFDEIPEDYGERYALFSCVMDTDEDYCLYYTSVTDYQVNKHDMTGALLWSTEGPSPYELTFSNLTSTGRDIVPVVWDLDVDGDRVYVVWAQGGDERGFRVDVFSTDNGELEGYFYTQTPSEERNWFIMIEGDRFYTVAYDEAIIYEYHMTLL